MNGTSLVGRPLHSVVAQAGELGLAPMLLILFNGVIAAAGLGMPAARLGESLGLPGALTFGALVVALLSWSFVRVAVKGAGAHGQEAADWLLILMAATIAFPFITLGFDAFWITAAAFALGVLGFGTLSRVHRVSGLAALAMAPAVVAVALPAVLGFTLLAMGWSPPFAAIQAAEAAPAPARD
jgi:hypothetical protein